MSTQLGIDVGGTFTDLVGWQPGRAPTAFKIPSTANQADAVLDAIGRALIAGDGDGVEVVHGTTVGTNAVLERRGARTALVTTRGFRDVLELGRRTRPDVYGLKGTFEPHVPRSLRFEVDERVDASGRELRPLNIEELDSVAEALGAAEVESVAVAFLHSYAQPAHEQAARDHLAKVLPNARISISAEVLPEIREFERTVATVVNAYLDPVLGRYLDSLSRRLGERTSASTVRVMQGNGGTAPIDEIVDFPVRTVLSGPAAGLTGAARVARELGIENCITCDMGGTSFDVGVIERGRPVATTELELEYNVPIRIPTLDIQTIGAGGGSIAYLDKGGLLRVGPMSAGASPGPIWYGRGGTRFTVTDANVLAGRISSPTLGTDFMPSGTPDGIWKTVESEQPELARTFRKPRVLADAVLRVVNANMAALVRDITVRRGRDPRDYVLMAFGGAGPLHALEIARELGIGKVVVPSAPGLLSAYGCLVADFAVDAIVTVRCYADEIPAESLLERLERDYDRVAEALSRHDPTMPVELRVLYECHFERQSHSLYVEGTCGDSGDRIREAFEQAYRETYGGMVPDNRVLVRSARIEGRGSRQVNPLPPAGDSVAPPVGVSSGLWRPNLIEGTTIAGPAAISAPDACIFVPSDARVTVVEQRHIVGDL